MLWEQSTCGLEFEDETLPSNRKYPLALNLSPVLFLLLRRQISIRLRSP
jgi:hypothetical protein